MSPDGSNRWLVDSTVRGTGRIAISPDGQLWAYSGVQGSVSVTDVFVRPAAGGPARQLTTNGLSPAPTWSPDGRQIAFLAASADFPYRTRVHVMSADGTGVVPVPTALAP